MNATNPKAGLAKLREPFDPKLISKLPKPTKAQTDEVKSDRTTGIKCTQCGTWHHRNVVHLDYVGHAALTDRLLDADPEWNWEPVKTNDDGTPALDQNGGMWIKLTVCGVTRLGYGDAQDKTGANAVKERIGDALRNAAMRFGAALDLWSKVDIHFDEHDDHAANAKPANKSTPVAASAASIPPINEEDQAYLQDLAGSLVEDVEVAGKITEAFDKMEAAKLDSDQKIILWALLAPNSKTRSALKKEGEMRRAAAAAPKTLA